MLYVRKDNIKRRKVPIREVVVMSNSNEVAPGIFIFNNVFPESTDYINKIEEMASNGRLRWVPAGVLHDQDGKEGVSKKARDTDYMGIPAYEEQGDSFLHEFSKKLNEGTKPFLDEYFKEYWVSIEKYEPPQLLRYGNNQHFHNHIDDHPQLTRRVSFSYYINEDYEGGEIEFPRFNLKIKPKAHQLVIFPSNFVYNHLVHPVTSGTRYVVVQWIA